MKSHASFLLGSYEVECPVGPVYLLRFWSQEEGDRIKRLLHATPGARYRLLDPQDLGVRSVVVHRTFTA